MLTLGAGWGWGIFRFLNQELNLTPDVWGIMGMGQSLSRRWPEGL